MDKASPPRRHPPVRGLERGLALLQALGALGAASAAELALATGLPRATVHRLLDTLQHQGYVTRPGSRDAWRLALKVRTLAESYKEQDWISEIGDPVMTALCEEVVWPVDLATYEQGEMVIRTATHQRSPLSISRVAAGRRFEMLNTSTGRAYLASCPARERNAILELLASRGVKAPPGFAHELELCRRRGYGLRVRGVPSPKTASLAVPVMHGEHVLACITLLWIASALSVPTAVRRYLAPMRRAAAEVEREYRRLLA